MLNGAGGNYEVGREGEGERERGGERGERERGGARGEINCGEVSFSPVSVTFKDLAVGLGRPKASELNYSSVLMCIPPLRRSDAIACWPSFAIFLEANSDVAELVVRT